ncbi:hypothetical protein ABLO15_06500 [Mycobacterium tuberculosis]
MTAPRRDDSGGAGRGRRPAVRQPRGRGWPGVRPPAGVWRARRIVGQRRGPGGAGGSGGGIGEAGGAGGWAVRGQAPAVSVGPVAAPAGRAGPVV